LKGGNSDGAQKPQDTSSGASNAFGGKQSFGSNYKQGKRKSYRDNIAGWNKKHTDRKISLIEIQLNHDAY